MRKLIVSSNLSLDGVMEAPQNWFGPLVETKAFGSGAVLLRYQAKESA